MPSPSGGPLKITNGNAIGSPFYIYGKVKKKQVLFSVVLKESPPIYRTS
jgi:hypothetical protein